MQAPEAVFPVELFRTEIMAPSVLLISLNPLLDLLTYMYSLALPSPMTLLWVPVGQRLYSINFSSLQSLV